MNILFLTMGRFESIEAHSIYADLLRCFRNNGHKIYTITPYEKRFGRETILVNENDAFVLHIKTGNVTGSKNLLEKGFAQLRIESIFINAIKDFFADVKFDLVLYSTPPIFFAKVVAFVKNRDGAASYLLLKDIFPQNAVDLGMMSKNGLKGLIYRYFRNKEKELYSVTDWIGCMSQANVDYLINNNSEIDPGKVEICPNSIEVIDKSVNDVIRAEIRKKYDIPLNKMVFIYGGNLGKPQGIPFLIKCIQKAKDINDALFLIIGDGTEFELLNKYAKKDKQSNFKLMQRLPKEDYDTLVGACDVGMIFLDHRFTIPNFPSRLLSYMQAKLPILAVTDPNTDLGRVIVSGNFGWWCESNDSEKFYTLIQKVIHTDLACKKEKAYSYLLGHYTSKICYNTIMSKFPEVKNVEKQ